MAPEGLQINLLAGLGRQSVYETPVAASQSILTVTENLRADSSPQMSEHRTGGRAVDYLGQYGHVRCAGPLVEQLRYLLTTDPAHPLLQQSFGAAYGHVYRNLTQENWVPLRVGVDDNVMLAWNFSPAATASLGIRIRIRLRRKGNPVGNLQMFVDGDDTGDPDEVPISNGTSSTVAASSITKDLNGQEVEFGFAVDPTLAQAALLHARLIGTYTPSAVDGIEMAIEDVPSGGNFEIKDLTWANDTTKNAVGRILTTSWTDSFVMADSIGGQFATIALDKGVEVHEYIGMKVTELSLRSTPNEMLRASYSLLGFDKNNSTPASTAALLKGLKNTRDFPLHHNLKVFVADQNDALEAGDAWGLDSFEARITRPLDQVFVTGQKQAIEPKEEGSGRVVLNVSLPRYAVDTWRDWQKNATKLQVRAQWNFGARYITLLVPFVLIDGQVDIQTSGAAPYAQQVTLNAFRNAGANGFMAMQEEAELSYLNV